MRDHDREQVQIDRLSTDQRELLQTYLRGAEIPFELTPTTVSVESEHVEDLFAALEIVGNALEDPDLDSPDAKPPLVAERPAVVFGQTIASPTRRLVGAIIDWVVITAVTIFADRAGAPNWMIVTCVGLYIVIATSLVGRTLGKFAAGTKVISARTGRPPNVLRSTIRWIVVSWGTVLELAFGTWSIGVATAIFAVLIATYAPIMWDPRCHGWHDRAADTIVVRGVR